MIATIVIKIGKPDDRKFAIHIAILAVSSPKFAITYTVAKIESAVNTIVTAVIPETVLIPVPR